MKVNEIINEGPKWDAVKSSVSKIGAGIGKAAGSVAGVGRAAVAAYNQGAEAVAKGYQAAATSMGGGIQIPNTPGAKTTLARYRADWEKFTNDYQQGRSAPLTDTEYTTLLNQYIRNKYGVDTSKYPDVKLASISPKYAANYIYAVNSRARADDLVNPSAPTTPAPTTPAPTNTTPAPSTIINPSTGQPFP